MIPMAELLSWIDPASAETKLNGETFYWSLIGRTGAFMPSVALVTQQVPQQPGAREKYVQIGEGNPQVPLLIKAGDEPTLAVARRALVYAMNPARGLGTLRSTAQDGAVRDLNCRLVDGLRGDESSQNRQPGAIFVDLQFAAADPFWYDTDYTVLSFGTGAPVVFLSNPFLGPNISSSGIASSFSVYNGGDVEAWPIWIITGPGNTIVLTNNTTGKSLTLSGSGGLTLSGGQVLTIDTRPGVKTVTREDGSNQFASVSSTSSLWELAPGNNSISLSIAGTSGASGLQLKYKQRYLGI